MEVIGEERVDSWMICCWKLCSSCCFSCFICFSWFLFCSSSSLVKAADCFFNASLIKRLISPSSSDFSVAACDGGGGDNGDGDDDGK